MRLRILLIGLGLLSSPVAAETASVCPDKAKPVVSLSFGSRYTDDSANRSDFDEEGDKAVTAALKPIDTFVADLARQTDVLNDPDTDPEKAAAAARCVMESIHAWAEADALSDLGSDGAQMSAPSRVGGIAFAYAAVRARQPDIPRDPVVEDWLAARARQTMGYFDNDAPPRASRNNLRAWAGLAVARIGLTLDDPALLDWAAGTVRLVACTAGEDGSLPNEMWRGRLALHYQMHAVAPLVTTAALLDTARPGLFEACNRAIPRIVAFTMAGLDDPSKVEEITGKAQSLGGKDHPARNFELAWLPAYLAFNDDPVLATFAQSKTELGNSKLGGNQRLLWPEPEPS